MHIVFISTENPYEKNNGGIGTYIKYITDTVSTAHNRIDIITLSHMRVGVRKLKGNVYLHEYIAPIRRPQFYMDYMEIFFKAVLYLHAEHPIDIIEVPDWLASGYRIGQETKIPLITRLHTPLFLIEEIGQGQKIYRYSEDIKRLEREQIRMSAAVSSPSRNLAKYIWEQLSVKADVIPNPINTEEVFGGGAELLPVELRGRDYLLYMGRLEYRKGAFVIGDIISDILERHQNLRIVFCGEDTMYKKKSVKQSILEKIRSRKEQVIFIDYAEGEEKYTLIKNSLFIVQPSLWENFSYVTLEAMCLNKCVIATKSGGFLDMIQDGETGYLVEAGAPDALLDCIDRALANNTEEIGLNAGKAVRLRYDTALLKEKFSFYYQKILDSTDRQQRG